jgi:hypothetical protein
LVLELIGYITEQFKNEDEIAAFINAALEELF